METDAAFQDFMSKLRRDRRMLRLVEDGVLPHNLAEQSPEVVVLVLAMRLADTQEQVSGQHHTLTGAAA